MITLDTKVIPPVQVITGANGIGKTSFACAMPKPIVIKSEYGLKSIDPMPDSFPLVESSDQLFSQIKQLLSESHDYETLIIDSVSALERLFTEEIVEHDGAKSINSALGGWGAGPNAVATLHQRLKKGCMMLNSKKNMHIVFISHSENETIEPPDAPGYTRYSMRMHKKSQAVYEDDADVVFFIKLRTILRDGKAISDSRRIISCKAEAANISKNRYGINKDFDFKPGMSPLDIINFNKQITKQTKEEK